MSNRNRRRSSCRPLPAEIETSTEMRLVMNTVPALIAYVDPQFHYRQVNQGYERWFGLPAREVEGRHVRDVLGRPAWKIVRPYLARALAGEVVTYEERMPYRLGEARWVYVTFVPDRDEAGRVRGLIAHVTDTTARKQAEEALRQSEERFKLLSETAERLLRSEHPQEIVNELCHKVMKHLDCQVFGTLSFGTRTRTRFSEDDLSLMKTVTDQVAVAMQRLRVEEALRRAHESLQVQSRELAATNKELKRQSGELEAQSVRLRESSRRLRLALEAGDMGHWEWDLRNDALSWCARSRQLLGVGEVAPVTHASFVRCLHPDDRETMERLALRTAAEPVDFQVDFRVLHHWHDGRGAIVWLAARGKVIRDEQGRGIRVIGVLHDITQRKQMEEQLRGLNERLEEEVEAQTETLRETVDRLQDEVVRRVLAEGKLRRRSQMLEGFFQHTLGPLAFLDRQCNFVRVNEAYARAEGRDAQDLVGQSYFALHPDSEEQAIFLQVVRERQPYRAYARPFRHPGDPREATYWDWQLTPLLDERGQVQFLVFSLEDVTERQKAFQELEQRARQLQKLTLELSQAEDRERRRLAEILHDDLQQQLAAAKFHLGILCGHLRQDETLQELAGQVDHMLKEAIARSRGLSHELSPAVLYQSDLGETLEWLAREMEAKHGLAVHVEVRGRVDLRADALKAFLYRAAQELLFNVVKHARVKEARLRLQRVRGQLWLTTSDQGRGFDPQTLGATPGFGLLGIRERVELLGGRMRIRSAKGRGSTFLIAVPDAIPLVMARAEAVTAEPSAAPGGPPARAEPEAQQRLRLLLVDDHKVMREGLAMLLAEQPDIEVVGQAGNGREAVDLAHQFRPDVVIMDVAMPVMAGDEATRQIKLYQPGVRVIALSMFDEPEMAERMRRAGATAYLLKTGPSEDLLAAIRGGRKSI
jgi:PAS domain S-box-containing protein